MKSKQNAHESDRLATKVSRDAAEKDVAAGFNDSQPILSSRSIKKSCSPAPTVPKSKNEKRKFNFGSLFDDAIPSSQPKLKRPQPVTTATKLKIAEQKLKSTDKKKSPSSKSADKNRVPKFKKGKGKQMEKSSKNIKSASSIDDDVSSSTDPITSDTKSLLHPSKNPIPIASLIVPKRAAATSKSLKEDSSSEGELFASQSSKSKKRSKDDEYQNSKADRISNANLSKELEAFQAFDMPVMKRSFQGPGIDMSKYKIQEAEIIPSSKQKCPIGLFCNSLIPKTLSPRLSRALAKYNDLKARCAAGEVATSAVVTARDLFCNLHHAEETVIPQGIRAKYRDDIDFANEITSRLSKPHHTQRFYDIIHRTRQSTFLEDVLATFAEMGQVKARGAEVLMMGAEKSQCGYYGNTGYSWIFKFLLDTYRADDSSPSPLKPSHTYPLTVIEFIQLVLIPEAALVLIAEDYDLDLENAKDGRKALKILGKSHEFGQILYPDSQDDLVHSISKRHHVI